MFTGHMDDEVLHFAEIADREWYYQSSLPEGETLFKIIGAIMMGWEVWSDEDAEGKSSPPEIFRYNEKSKALQLIGSEKTKRISPFYTFPAFLVDKKVVRPFKINSKDIFKEMTRIQNEYKPKQPFENALCYIKKTKAAGGQAPWKYEFGICMARDGKGNISPINHELTPEELEIITNYPIDVSAAFRGVSPYL